MDFSIVGTIILIVLGWRAVKWLMTPDRADHQHRHHGLW